VSGEEEKGGECMHVTLRQTPSKPATTLISLRR
jgi:hypothetical protein